MSADSLMSDAVMVPRAWLLKVVDTLKPFSEVAEKLRHCHVVEICEPHPDNPSPNIAVMPREWLERAGDDLEAAVIVLHRDGALSEGQVAKLTGLDRVEVRKLSDALAASTPVGGWEGISTAPKDGTRFLAWGGGLDDEIETCSYSSGTGCWNLETYTADDTDDEPQGYCRPTHWRPLPPSPSVSIDNGSLQRQGASVPTEQAEPAVVADDGWIEWSGGRACPVADDVVIQRWYRDGLKGAEVANTVAGWLGWHWNDRHPEGDIIAYRILPQTEKGS